MTKNFMACLPCYVFVISQVGGATLSFTALLLSFICIRSHDRLIVVFLRGVEFFFDTSVLVLKKYL